jgi:hypothetical protein
MRTMRGPAGRNVRSDTIRERSIQYPTLPLPHQASGTLLSEVCRPPGSRAVQRRRQTVPTRRGHGDHDRGRPWRSRRVPALIEHWLNHTRIDPRAEDGSLNATAIDQAAGTLIGHYLEIQQAQAFFAALAGCIGIPIDRLLRNITTGPHDGRNTWVHPQVASHLAVWCSPVCVVQVTAWITAVVQDVTRPRRRDRAGLGVGAGMANAAFASVGH